MTRSLRSLALLVHVQIGLVFQLSRSSRGFHVGVQSPSSFRHSRAASTARSSLSGCSASSLWKFSSPSTVNGKCGEFSASTASTSFTTTALSSRTRTNPDDHHEAEGSTTQPQNKQKRSASYSQYRRREWLEQATARLTSSPVGSLDRGKWHEVVSIFLGWSALAKRDPRAPLQMEVLLKRLLDERILNEEIPVTIDLYNRLLDAWACAALFRTLPKNKPASDAAGSTGGGTINFTAAQRAREILVSLQEKFEQTRDLSIQPTRKSFELVLHAVCRTEGPFIARRVLAWMEHLTKSGKNPAAQPTRSDYILVLGAYANLNSESSRNNKRTRGAAAEEGGWGHDALGTVPDAGALAEGFLRHMKAMRVPLDALCYNIAIKAWIKATRYGRTAAAALHNHRGREAAEHADRILETMEAEPDLVTYASVISAWAASGMRSHAVTRAEEVLAQIKEKGLEPNNFCLK